MSRIFDGMASALNDMFGASVTLTDPLTSATTSIKAVFREEPIEVGTENAGPVIVEQPTLRVPKSIAASLRRGTRVTIADGRQFQVESFIPSGSPATDRFTICTLELVQ
jgi:hypothetical protein